jgi:arylsulfatase A
MGLSFWLTLGWKPSLPYEPTPLPLLNGTKVVEQPCGLHTVVRRYSDAAVGFIGTHAKAGTPFYLYVPYNHVHHPNSCGPDFCGKSTRGPIGDAVEEMDWSVGHIMGALKTTGVDNNTLVFFTRLAFGRHTKRCTSHKPHFSPSALFPSSSDNGAPQRPDGNTPLRGFKGSTWEGM